MQNNLQKREPGFFMRMFWKACGADRHILEKCGYREHVKYACLGGIVVATGLMAGLAGGYAFYTIFEPKGSALETGTDIPTLIISIIFGIIWGTIIFNIDRFIVTSTGQGDGTEAITRDEFLGALPRIFMGIIIAITISKPLEIRIFKNEIDVELEKAQIATRQEFIREIDEIYDPQINKLNAKISKLEAEMKSTIDRYSELEDEYHKEITRKERRGVGPIANAIKVQMDRMEAEIEEVRTKNSKQKEEAQRELTALDKEVKIEKAKKEEMSNRLDGLLERIKLSHEIAGFWITLFITLLFVAIELTPIFFKLMLIKSPYDFLSDNEKELIKARAGIEIKYNYYQDKKGVESDLVIFHNSNKTLDEQKRLSKAQEELNEYVVQKWLEQEKQKVDQNVDQFIRIHDNGNN